MPRSTIEMKALIKPNQKELEALIGPWNHKKELFDKVNPLQKELNIPYLLVTMGSAVLSQSWRMTSSSTR